MSEKLYFNILSFDWPSTPPKFYFSLEDLPNSHRIHRSKFSPQILKAFPNLKNSDTEFIYTTFLDKTENAVPLEMEMYGAELQIYKQYLRNQIKNFFKEKGFVVRKNFVQDLEVWLPSKKDADNYYKSYHKFSLKIQFAQVSKNPELIVSFDGISNVANASIAEIEDTTILKKFIFEQKLFHYQKMQRPKYQELYNKIQFETAFPLLNRELTKELGIDIPVKKEKNKYIKYLKNIQAFAKAYLFTEEFKQIIPIYRDDFIRVPPNRINHLDPNLGMLEYANKNKGLIPKFQLGKYKPYLRPKAPNIKFIFIHHESHQEKIRKLNSYLKKGTGEGTYYPGLEKYVNIKANMSGAHFIEYKNIHNPLPEIIDRLGELNFDHENVLYGAFYLSPFDKFASKREERMLYNNIKELMLNEGIIVQTIDFHKMEKDIEKPQTYQYHLNNMSLALHAKLGGVPWKLATTDKKELVIGVGAFTHQDENRRYIASAFSFQNNGLFRGFDYFSESDSSALAGSICKKIRAFTSLEKPEKVIIHFYKEMNKKEIEPIQRGMKALELDVPLYVLNINKTDAKDLIAYDIAWKDLMPKSGTFIRIGKNKFLLFNNARYESKYKYPSSEGFPFPIKISISSPDEDAFEDTNVIEELITQVYQFSRLYWKSLRQQNVPVTIKYPEMLAQIAPKFEAPIPEHSKNKLWFL